MEKKSVELVAGHESAEGLQPADGALNDPAFAVALQPAAVLGGGPHASSPMGADQLNPTLGQSLPQRITVGCAIIDQPTGNARRHGLIEQRLDQSYFGRAGGGHVDCQWQSVPVDEDHELAAL